ncbi:hypothetical protein LshimejAT787_1002260 [Lyophyllum shimeji]|uniref:CCHC-type domain-containing protein n=1 Tax=Lyophyllum shimeji TaxID=47721 RepID=A0A9P3PUR9_LYOSH|nr:hypothetical protein LshimejAT787_1002260 [Lyophyllum shimeji]
MAGTIPPKGIPGMPTPGSKRAPYFDPRDPTELLEFLDEFEELAKDCGLTDAEKMKTVGKYTERKTKKFWESLPAYAEDTKDYAKLRDEILDAHPGAKKGERYSLKDLERIVRRNETHRIKSEADIVAYYQDFRPVAVSLENDSQISANDKNRLFWRGLHMSAQKAIKKRLEITEGKSFSRSKVPDMEKAVEAGREVFADDAFDAEERKPKPRRKGKGKRRGSSSDEDSSDESETESESESESESEESSSESEEEERRRKKRSKKRSKKKSERREVRTKTVAIKDGGRKDGGRKDGGRKDEVDELEELARQLGSMNVNDHAYTASYLRFAVLAPDAAKLLPSPWSSRSPTPTAVAAAAPAYHAPRVDTPPPQQPQYPYQQPQHQWNRGGGPRGFHGHGGHGGHGGHAHDPNSCHFCRQLGHASRDCPHAIAHFNAGHIHYIRTGYTTGYWVWTADGGRIPHHMDGIRQAVEARYGVLPVQSGGGTPAAQHQTAAPAPPGAAGGNFIQVFAPGAESCAVIQEVREVEDETAEEAARGAVAKDEEGGREEVEVVVREAEDDDDEAVVWGAIEELEKAAAGVTYATRSKGKKVEGQREEKRTTKHEGKRAKEDEGKKEHTVIVEEEKPKTVTGKTEKGEASGEKKENYLHTDAPQPAYTYESKAADPAAAQKFYRRIVDAIVPNITVGDLFSLSGELRKDVVENLRTVRVPNPAGRGTTVAAFQTKIDLRDIPLDFVTPLRELLVEVAGVKEDALLDEGSEIVVVRRDLWEELGLKVNRAQLMTMETANGGRETMDGCAEFLEIEVEGMKTWAHAYVVPNAPYRLLLGRPWQKSVLLAKVETEAGVWVTLQDPRDRRRRKTVAMRERPSGKRATTFTCVEDVAAAWREDASADQSMPLTQPPPDLADLVRTGPIAITNILLASTFAIDPVTRVLAYKKVANKILPVPTTMPEYAKVRRRFPEDPLCTRPGRLLDPARSSRRPPPASVLHPPASVLIPPDSSFLHRRIPDSRLIVAPRVPHITIQFLQGKGSLDLFSLDLPLPASCESASVQGSPLHPLKSLPALPIFLPNFVPGIRLTQDRMDALGLMANDFLWEEERKLIAAVLMNNEMALAWDESEKGRFRRV